MNRAIQLAKLGAGKVAPNPMVGCLIVHENKIIGEGWHQKFGETHAEVNAINSVVDQSKLSESTVYVSLEPCSHFGKTPPCADLLIEKKVRKVFVCNLDPNPLVAGKGIEKLRAAGIEVVTGVLEKKGRKINKRFFTFMEKKRPYIILKWAETADGFIAGENGKAIQISNEFSTKLVHKMRSENDAIMVGTNTTQWDNPSLTTRNWTGNNPIRVLIDKQLRFKQTMNVFNEEAETLIYNLHGSATLTTGGSATLTTGGSATLTTGADGKIANAQYVKLPETDDFLQDLIQDLYERKVQSILVEGGRKLLDSFIDLGLWDEIMIIKSQNIIEKGIASPSINFPVQETIKLGSDSLFYFNNETKLELENDFI